ncbi:DUF1572 domain-containing protein [Caldinitratiruptor microaerophilus]|uniref:DinB superfamily protein n=1 Tax=Caldinitratiruptor microaerophilus TaxID=671077 RepID=A0AA35CID5_9FIRM|nr:DUF1572 domain-containing protein [Caldinitratiruptor microaerophilus]BDG59582.1 hypothetical protein caldi_06720 [Caldinitratiruptor microaerophilus]
MDLGQTVIRIHRDRLRDLHRRAGAAIEQLRDEDVNWRPNEESNSIANLVLHMAGNIGQRLVSAVGGAPDTRDRDAEFNSRDFLTRDRVLEILGDAFGAADRVLETLSAEQLAETRRVRDREMTVLDLIFGVATHLSEHVGQILYIAKMRLGPDYRVQSTPHRKG